MKQYQKNIRSMTVGLLLLILLVGTLAACGKTQKAYTMPQDASALAKEVAAVLMEENENPMLSSIGGEWMIKGITHAGIEVPQEYYDIYYDNVRAEVKSKQGILSETKYTTYERLIIGLASIGKDFTDIEGYDMRPFLDDFDKIEAQGMNAACYALLAARVGDFTLANEEAYIQMIITETKDLIETGDAYISDYIAMAMQALSFYRGREEIDAFIEESIAALAQAQHEDGSLGNCESTVEAIIALTQVDIDIFTDARFIKNDKTLADGLLLYYIGDGKFVHVSEMDTSDPLATEKALLALDAVVLSQEGKKLYE